MHGVKNAAASVKESASNVTASARSGMEKAKATAQEKVDKTRAHDEAEKQMATEKKMERIEQAELGKQEVREHNAAAKHATGHTASTPAAGTTTYSTTGEPGHTTGAQQMSALPGDGTGEPVGGYEVDGSETGFGANNPRTTRPGYGTDSTYST